MSPRAAARSRAQVLFVCTANQCRSPLAEAIARADGSALPIDFASAGLITGGYPVPKTGIKVAKELGLDLTGHTSARIDYDSLDRFDVILTMTREHAREILAARDDLWPRVFTLKQFARWLPEHPTARTGGLRTRLARDGANRDRSELLGSSPIDDIRDPIGKPARLWRSVAAELRESIDGILDSLYRA